MSRSVWTLCLKLEDGRAVTYAWCPRKETVCTVVARGVSFLCGGQLAVGPESAFYIDKDKKWHAACCLQLKKAWLPMMCPIQGCQGDLRRIDARGRLTCDTCCKTGFYLG